MTEHYTLFKDAVSNPDHAWNKSVLPFLTTKPDVEPASVVVWAKEFVWVRNLLDDAEARTRSSDTTEQKRLEQASLEARFAAALVTAKIEKLEFDVLMAEYTAAQ